MCDLSLKIHVLKKDDGQRKKEKDRAETLTNEKQQEMQQDHVMRKGREEMRGKR